MVRALHEADIEVILDVVYNHTAEGNHMGPTLSMRGIDNAAYYRLVDDDKRYYMDYTGTGNSLNVGHPHSLQLIMDSLRYWVTEMHVDGFRFDLASTLAREFYDVDKLSTFFELVQQDPTVSQVKLIAEPWDVGPGGYQVGNFPPQWTEWNGKYRDTVRDFWRGEPATPRRVRLAADRLGGPLRAHRAAGRSRRSTSSPPTTASRCGTWCPTTRSTTTPTARTTTTARATTGRGTAASRARPTTRRSWRCGPSRSATSSPPCCCRQGVPMICHGDELGRTQGGNNNGYCQDNEITWIDWAERRHGADRVHPRRCRRCGPRTRCSAAAGSSTACRSASRGSERLPDISWFAPRRFGDERRGLGLRLRQVGRGLPQRPGHPGSATRAASGSPTIRSCCASTPTTSRSTSPCRQRNSGRRGSR